MADRVLVDSGYQTKFVYVACAEAEGVAQPWMPARGFGTSQAMATPYRPVKQTGARVAMIGDGYHVARLQSPRVRVVEFDADQWKSWVHARLSTPLDQPGSMTLYQAVPTEHLGLAKHLTAEKQIQEWAATKGLITKWVAVHRNNHWLDAAVLAAVAGHMAGARVEPDAPKAVGAAERPQTDWFARQQKGGRRR